MGSKLKHYRETDMKVSPSHPPHTSHPTCPSHLDSPGDAVLDPSGRLLVALQIAVVLEAVHEPAAQCLVVLLARVVPDALQRPM